ncbi:hypothetical protein JVX98_28200 [Ensifer sp. PDNC004]|nr:hypothetical protein [Ensifer sp. PDNC004]QRY68173.1 hypothetical protein JVX98_28200 [Ensifer sp. PDNC004]
MAKRARRHDPQASPDNDKPVWIVRGALAAIASSLIFFAAFFWTLSP